MKRPLFFLLVFWVVSAGRIEAAGERLFYVSEGKVLQGVVFKPKGEGPFPGIVFNQNLLKTSNDTDLARPPEIARFLNGHGYVLFLPGRHKSSVVSAGDTDAEGASAGPSLGSIQQYTKDIFAGMMTLKAQSYVDPNRIVVMGTIVGGAATLLLAEQNLDVRGYVAFSPATEAWQKNEPFRRALIRAVETTDAPIFVAQPRNDVGLESLDSFEKALSSKGPPNRVKVYPPFGKTLRESRGFGYKGPDVWGDDVLAFIAVVTK